MKHSATKVLFEYWDELRGERSSPERSEIDPGSIRHVLADTFICEVDEAANHPIRLAGTRVCALFGREVKGHGLTALWGSEAGVREARALVTSAALPWVGLDPVVRLTLRSTRMIREADLPVAPPFRSATPMPTPDPPERRGAFMVYRGGKQPHNREDLR
jgi:hypothetical protein